MRVYHLHLVKPVYILAEHQGSDDSYLGVSLLDRLVETVVVLSIAPEHILVPDLDILQREWLRMAVLRPERSPLCRLRIPYCILYSIQGILDKWLESLALDIVTVPEQAGHPGVADKHGVRAYVLAELEELMISEPVCAAVAPQIVLPRTGDRITDSLLPFNPVLESQSLNDAAARPPDECRMKTRYQPRNVLPQSVLPSLERILREKGHVVKPHTAFRRKGDLEGIACPGNIGLHGDCITVPLSVGGQGHIAGCDPLPGRCDYRGTAPGSPL